MLVICFATAPVRICAVFVRPHRYLFIILESGNMFLNSLTAWSAVLKGRLCLARKPEKSSSAFSSFWSKFAVVDLAPKLVTFFVVVLHPYILIPYPHITYRLKCPCVYWSHFLLHVQQWNCFHTHYIKQNLHLCGISEWTWIYYTTNHWIPHNILFFDGANSELSTIFFSICFAFFHGNDFTW